MKNKILNIDLNYILNELDENEIKKFNNATILITGCGGFLGFYFLNLFLSNIISLKIKKVIGIDNFLINFPDWISELSKKYSTNFTLYNQDINEINLEEITQNNNINYIIHAASIASPTFYRKYPIETIDANIWGLRKLLDFFNKSKSLNGFLFFSSSEIYGDPDSKNIPTTEIYNGNVSSIGPRSCYDESKRFGETLCWVYANTYNMPITIARPFNNFGPGMSINDKRLPADFAFCILNNKDISILSDGNPTRTFCYIADAIIGYIKCLLYGKFDIFNIGSSTPEISVLEFANIYHKLGKINFRYTGKITFQKSNDINYLINNPNRRCPNIDKALNLLNYNPKTNLEDGVKNYLLHLNLNK